MDGIFSVSYFKPKSICHKQHLMNAVQLAKTRFADYPNFVYSNPFTFFYCKYFFFFIHFQLIGCLCSNLARKKKRSFSSA